MHHCCVTVHELTGFENASAAAAPTVGAVCILTTRTMHWLARSQHGCAGMVQCGCWCGRAGTRRRNATPLLCQVPLIHGVETVTNDSLLIRTAAAAARRHCCVARVCPTMRCLQSCPGPRRTSCPAPAATKPHSVNFSSTDCWPACHAQPHTTPTNLEARQGVVARGRLHRADRELVPPSAAKKPERLHACSVGFVVVQQLVHVGTGEPMQAASGDDRKSQHRHGHCSMQTGSGSRGCGARASRVIKSVSANMSSAVLRPSHAGCNPQASGCCGRRALALDQLMHTSRARSLTRDACDG